MNIQKSVIILFFFSNLAFSDVNSPTTLDEYITIATSNNAELSARYEEYKASREQIIQAKTLPDPTLKYGYATEETPTRSTFEVMQEIPWFGTIESRKNYASALSSAAMKRYDAKRLEILNNLKRWFYEYSFLYSSVNITIENMNLARQLERVAREKYATMTTEHPDIIKAQIILANLEYNKQNLKAYRQPLVVKLNSILNRDPSAGLKWPQKPIYQPVSLNFDIVNTLVMQNNPDLIAMNYDVAAARSERTLAEKKFYPNLGLGVAIDAGMGRDGHSRVMPVVAINIPLWRKSYDAGERAADAMVNKSVKEKKQRQNDLSAAAQQSLYELEDSTRKIHLYKDILIPKSKEHFIAAQNSYQTGTSDFLTMLDSLQSLYGYQLLYERAMADYAQKLAELEMLTGVELSKKFPEIKLSWNPERNTK
ncbi:MAG: TolC family protein [Phycisphaerales bacterium]